MSNYQIAAMDMWLKTHELAPNGIRQVLINYAGTDVDTPANRQKAYKEYVRRMKETQGVLHKEKPLLSSTPSPKVIKV